MKQEPAPVSRNSLGNIIAQCLLGTEQELMAQVRMKTQRKGAEKQPNGAKRLDCVELAPAFEPSPPHDSASPSSVKAPVLRNGTAEGGQVGCTPNAARGSSSAKDPTA